MDERMKTCQWTERRKLSVCKNWAPEGRIVGNWKRWVWIGAVSGGQRGGLLVSKAASVTTWKQHFLRLWFLQRGGTFSLGGRREVLVHSSGSKSRRILHSLFFLFFSVFFASLPPPPSRTGLLRSEMTTSCSFFLFVNVIRVDPAVSSSMTNSWHSPRFAPSTPPPRQNIRLVRPDPRPSLLGLCISLGFCQRFFVSVSSLLELRRWEGGTGRHAPKCALSSWSR